LEDFGLSLNQYTYDEEEKVWKTDSNFTVKLSDNKKTITLNGTFTYNRATWEEAYQLMGTNNRGLVKLANFDTIDSGTIHLVVK
jgi:hypothetical protein